MDRRAWALKREYKGAMTELDRKYLGTIQLVHRVGGQGLQVIVIRRQGECSQDLHQLIQGMEESQALHLARSTGRKTSAGEMAIILNSYRRILSCRFIWTGRDTSIWGQGMLQ